MPKVASLKSSADLKSDISQLIKEIGDFSKFISPGDKVLLKPNFNTADPPPASTDLKFLQVVTELVIQSGAEEVIIGESSTMFQKTADNLKQKNAFSLEKISDKVSIHNFDQHPWTKQKIPRGKYLKSVSTPAILDQVDKIILLPCLKTHSMANFTGALKLAVGLMKPSERLRLHARNLEPKIAELNLVYKPDLIIMDARKCFITQGPSKGELREPRLILASTDRVAIDLEGIKIIQQYPGNSLSDMKPEDIPQISHALKLKIS